MAGCGSAVHPTPRQSYDMLVLGHGVISHSADEVHVQPPKIRGLWSPLPKRWSPDPAVSIPFVRCRVVR